MYREIMLFEHTWATKLKEAILNSGVIDLVRGMPSPLAPVEIGVEVAAAVEVAERLDPD